MATRGRKPNYSVALTDVERKLLKQVQRKAISNNMRRRCKILLAADVSNRERALTYEEIAHKAGCSYGTALSALKDFYYNGIEFAISAFRNPKSDAANAKLDGVAEARICAIALSKAPEGYTRWTLRLLKNKLFLIYNYQYCESTIGTVLRRYSIRPHVCEEWCIPPEENAEFVAAMEDVLDVYQRKYDEKHPLWCMDEKPFQLLDNVREPLPMRMGDPMKIDSEYERDGVVSIFVFIEPQTAAIHQYVSRTRTAVDWAERIKWLVDDLLPDAELITLVCDNLNTHAIASLYKRYPPAEANRIARKLDIHYTPKHGSWLDIAELGINIMTRECLGRRIPGIEALQYELNAWEKAYNAEPGQVNWQFVSEDARVKLKHLYPDIDKHILERDELKASKEKDKKAD